jgi:hypothetical protein
MGIPLEVILKFQLYMSSQFYPEWRATVAGGTRARGLGATINRTRPQNIVIWRTSERWWRKDSPPTLVLFWRSVAGRPVGSTFSISCFYTNSRLQARVLPARSEMVTTLTAQMSDLLAAISKSTTRTQSTYINRSVHGTLDRKSGCWRREWDSNPRYGFAPPAHSTTELRR